MAKFTTTNHSNVITSATMRKGGTKRLHLHAVGGDPKKIKLVSSQPSIAATKMKGLFDGPSGIWSFDLSAFQNLGNATITAFWSEKKVAQLSVTVTEPLVLPEAATNAGMFARIFLAEAVNPGRRTVYDADESKTAMQWMRLVIENRLKNPSRFGAPGATTVTDIVKGAGQFKGFEDYPKIDLGPLGTINDVVKTANNDNFSRQDDYATFVQNALDVANAERAVADPSAKGLYGWRTAGSSHPGGDFIAYKTPKSGNQFYTVKD